MLKVFAPGDLEIHPDYRNLRTFFQELAIYLNLLCPPAAADKLGALCLSPCVTARRPMQAWMAGMGRVPRAAEREGSAGAAGRCPWLWCQGRDNGSWHLLSPCREARTAPARPDSKRLLCPCVGNGEPAERDGQGRGAPSPTASIPPCREPSPTGCPRPQTPAIPLLPSACPASRCPP